MKTRFLQVFFTVIEGYKQAGRKSKGINRD